MQLNCSDIQVYLGDAIDRFLPKHLEKAFYSHLEACIKCRNEFELEKLSKRVVQLNIHRQSAPREVYGSVVFSLHQEYQSTPGARKGLLAILLGQRLIFPAIASGLAILVFFFFVSPPSRIADSQSDVHTASNDVIGQAYKNFSLVRSGEMQPTMVSCFPESVTGYFEQNGVTFAVTVVEMPACDWYGAVASEYSGVKQAHVMYKMGNDWVYVYQVCEKEVMDGSTFSLPPAAKSSLKQSGWYTDPDHPDCSVVLWSAKGTLCSAVSTMKKDKLLAMLATR